ncbi:LysR family transcriptional regulator [Burkholderia metallica]|uniref:LysR family transcriptional regulator n=1 Tax=Burkholderia metallica TaxID=488729 RepID=UPI00157AE2B2|nr:LysR family transcriptional regulator [Burkholderia metallica]NTZ83613.1 LysR family transcriptional regulator [Burkholderia metallica]
MDLRHLKYFVTVAEERHFTRAAERLGIGQPPLSIQIKQLERELGTALFRRLSRGVALTDAGALLLDNAQQIFALVERSVSEVQRLSRGETGNLRVGFAGATYFQPLIPEIVREYRTRYPDVRLSPEQSNTPQLLEALDAGRIDVAFIRPPIEPSETREITLLAKEEMVAVLPRAHRLARVTEPVRLAELANETFILFPRAIGTGLYDSIVEGCRHAGFEPKLTQDASQIASIVPMVGAGFGVSIVPRSISQIRMEEVVYLPISDTIPKAQISIVWRRNERSLAVRHFLAITKLAVTMRGGYDS